MKLKMTSAGAILATLLLATSTQAAPITGSITLSADSSSVAIDFGANTVTFNPASPTNNSKVDTVTGNMASLAPVTTQVSYKNFQYSPLSVVGPLWTTATGLSFTLTGITSVNEIGNSALVLFGTGTLSSTNLAYDPTPGEWSFNASETSTVFSWGSTATARVPDGGATLGLLGISILGLGGTRRFLTSRK